MSSDFEGVLTQSKSESFFLEVVGFVLPANTNIVTVTLSLIFYACLTYSHTILVSS
jgi:hypothetical protein